VVIDHSHDRHTAAFTHLTGEAVARTKCLPPDTFSEPTNQETEAGAAHAHDVFFIPESLGHFVVLNMRGEKESRYVM
jgi:hypothetical protein